MVTALILSGNGLQEELEGKKMRCYQRLGEGLTMCRALTQRSSSALVALLAREIQGQGVGEGVEVGEGVGVSEWVEVSEGVGTGEWVGEGVEVKEREWGEGGSGGGDG